MLVTLFGIFMLIKLWQFQKAEFPILVTLFGITTLARLLQS